MDPLPWGATKLVGSRPRRPAFSGAAFSRLGAEVPFHGDDNCPSVQQYAWLATFPSATKALAS